MLSSTFPKQFVTWEGEARIMNLGEPRSIWVIAFLLRVLPLYRGSFSGQIVAFGQLIALPSSSRLFVLRIPTTGECFLQSGTPA